MVIDEDSDVVVYYRPFTFFGDVLLCLSHSQKVSGLHRQRALHSRVDIDGFLRLFTSHLSLRRILFHLHTRLAIQTFEREDRKSVAPLMQRH
jgi:hypothetical protein